MKLHDRFYDREERVRIEVVKAVCAAASENFEAIPKIVSCVCARYITCHYLVLAGMQLCDDLEGRMRDKVVGVTCGCDTWVWFI